MTRGGRVVLTAPSESKDLMRRSLLLLLLLFSVSLRALDVPPKPQAWIEDHANLFSAAQQQAINEKLENFFKANGARLYVVTMPSLQGEDVTDYTNRVVNTWKLKKSDRIAVMFIFPQDRKYWLQSGYGLEGELTDAFTSGVYRNTIVPNFRAGEYYAGVDQALNQLAKQIDPQWTPPASSVQPVQREEYPARRTVSPGFAASDVIKLVILGLVVFFILLPMMRRGGCGGCIGCIPLFPFGGGWGGTTFGGGGWGGGGGGGGGGGWSAGSGWSSGGGSSFGGGGSGGGW